MPPKRVERELGPIDVWVNVAMTSVFAFIKDTTAAEFKRVTDVCYLGYVNGTLPALKRMLPRNRGHIIQVGSALAYRGIPLQAAYCAGKHAIQGFMDSLNAELVHDRSDVIACNGPDAGAEHASVRLVPKQASKQGAARFRLFSSQKSPRRRSSSLPRTNAARFTSACRPLLPSWGTSSSPASATGISASPASAVNRPARKRIPGNRTIFTSQ